MKIQLRVVNPETRITHALNHKFIAQDVASTFEIFPIPEWLKDATCECGKPAKFLCDDKPTCQEHLINCLKERKNKLVKEKDLSVPLVMNTIRKMAFEWSTGSDKWYRVSGRNIRINGDADKFLEIIKPVLLNDEESAPLEGEYEKEVKILTITP